MREETRIKCESWVAQSRQGKRAMQIARESGTTKQNMYALLSRAGLKLVKVRRAKPNPCRRCGADSPPDRRYCSDECKALSPRPRGEDVAHSRLTAANVKAIKEARAAGAKLKDLAKEYGVSIGNVCHICKGRIWK